MNYQRILTALVIGLFSYTSLGQVYPELNDFDGLSCQGEPPRKALMTASEWHDELMIEYGQKTFPGSNRMKGEFYVSSGVALSNFLRSSNILYGDTLSDYVSQVTEALQDELGFDEDIQVIVYNSSVANAFTPGGGMVFVTTGLIARMGTVEELAFVISHEIVHLEHHDVYHSFAERSKVKREYRYSNFSDGIRLFEEFLQKRRDVETRCDEEAYEAMCSSNMLHRTPSDTLLNAVLRGDFAFAETRVDSAFFNRFDCDVPNDLFIRANRPIRLNMDRSNIRETHPNLRDRRSSLSSLGCDEPSHESQLESLAMSFPYFKQVAQLEVLDQMLRDQRYGESLYNAYSLSLIYPQSEYLDVVMAKSLYGLAQFKLRNNMTVLSRRMSAPGGKLEVSHNFWKSATKEQASVIALKFLLMAKERYPDNVEFEVMTQSLITDMVVYGGMSVADLSESGPFEPSFRISADEYAKAPERKRLFEAQIAYREFYRYQLTDKLQDGTELRRQMESAYSKRDSLIEWRELSFKERRRKLREQERTLVNQGTNIQAEKIIIVEPKFLVLKRKLRKSDLEGQSENGVLVLTRAGERSLVDLIWLNRNDLTADSIEKLAEIQALNQFLQEAYFLYKFDIQAVPNAQVMAIARRYGTPFGATLHAYDIEGVFTKAEYVFALVNLMTGEMMYIREEEAMALDQIDQIKKIFQEDLRAISN